MDQVEAVRTRFERMRGSLNERGRRLFAAAEALAIGWGGVAIVAQATGMAPSTIGEGKKEIRAIEELRAAPLAPTRSRRPGGGRKKTTEKDPTLVTDLDRLVEPVTRGDPMSALRWTSKSAQHLAGELVSQ